MGHFRRVVALGGGILCLFLYAALPSQDSHARQSVSGEGQKTENQRDTKELGRGGTPGGGSPPATFVEHSNVSAGASEESKKIGEEGRGELETWLREHLQTSLMVEYTTFLVAVLAAFFGIFLAFFTYLETTRFKGLKREIAEQRRILKQSSSELREEWKSSEREAQRLKVDLDIQERKLVGYQRFLEGVLSNHSDLLVGLVEGFGTALQPEEERRLRSLIFEVGAVLDLFHPDKVRVVNALWNLEQIGGDNAVGSLVQLRDDPATDGGIRVGAERALSKIRERLKEERRKSLVQPRGNGPSNRPAGAGKSRRSPKPN